MRTFALSKDITPKETCDYLRKVQTIYSTDNSTQPECVRPAFQSISGLFMFDKPLCVRTDLKDIFGWSPYKEGDDLSRHLPETLVSAIEEWYERGTGTPIIHMRNYLSQAYQGRRANARTESYPYKTNDGTYFYHLGRYGNSGMWSRVANARTSRKSVPEVVYNYCEFVKIQYHSSMIAYNEKRTDVKPLDWIETLAMNHNYEQGEDRPFRIFEWRDGEILDSHTNSDKDSPMILDVKKACQLGVGVDIRE